MKKYVLFLSMFLFVMATNARAWECEYGEAKAWVKLSNDSQWREAMVDDVTLKVHEPFKVKVQVTTKTDCHVALRLYDPGVTKVFEVVDGPSKNDQSLYVNNCPANWSKTYEWTVRPTGKWTGAYGPWNIRAQFTKTMENYEIIDKTIIHAYISPEEWKESDGSNNQHHTPGFEFAVLSIAMMMYIWRRRKVG